MPSSQNTAAFRHIHTLFKLGAIGGLTDRQLLERGKAIEIYREILNHETDPRHHEEANRRLADLSAAR